MEWLNSIGYLAINAGYRKHLINVLLFSLGINLIPIQSCCDDDPTNTGTTNQTNTTTTTTTTTQTPTNNAITDSRMISITPIAQQTEVWCWAAVSEMVLRYYQLPNLNGAGNYQCGIVAAYYGPNSTCWQNCFSCVSPVGGMSEMQKIVNQYGLVARNLGVQSRLLSSTLLFRGLALTEIAEEIRNGRPIIAGISPNGFALPNASQHVTLVVGYDATGANPFVIVNDPFPFGLPQFGGQPNPYVFLGATQLQPGQYKILLSAFISNMKWANTVYQIK